MTWNKKASNDPMTWLVEHVSESYLCEHLTSLVKRGWFVHSVAPVETAAPIDILVVSCKRQKAPKKKTAPDGA